MTRRSVLIASAGVIVLLAVFCMSRVYYSPRLEALEPHIRLGATRAEFVAVLHERRFPFETAHDPDERVELRVPLNGTMWCRRLQLRFDPAGELVWAAVIDRSGKIDYVRFHVRK
jgi:hypothetical protein